MLKINKEKCVGCGVCVQSCPGATEIGDDGKAKIIDQEKLKECGGESVCPFGAIENLDGEEKSETDSSNHTSLPPTTPSHNPPLGGQDMGRGMGRGMGAGKGRGLGLGPRDGRGMGQGRGKGRT